MYRKSFVACIKVQSQILRESEDTVRLPFGSEYALPLKNLAGRRAVVSVSIDGQDVLDGRRLVLEPGQSIELERFIKDGNLHKGNRFRFIHKDSKIQAHRGDRVDDGIVRISWQYEQPRPTFTWSYCPASYPRPQFSPQWGDFRTYSGTDTQSLTHDGTADVRAMSVPCNATASAVPLAAPHIPTPQADEGITVAGSQSTQTFSQTYVGALEPEVHVITLRLLGESPITGQAVEKPVTVREKLECPTCGTDNTSKHHYCGECGTCLGD